MTDKTTEELRAELEQLMQNAPETPAESDGPTKASTGGSPEAEIEATKTGGSTSSGGVRRRLVGGLALLLGTVGAALAILVAVLMIRFGFGATSTVDSVVGRIDSAVERLDVRIDETDDLIGSADGVGELEARTDGLLDVAVGAKQSFDTIEEHPLYGRLPVDLSGLGTILNEFEETSRRIESTVGASDGALDAAAEEKVSEQLNTMQARVSEVDDEIDDAARSLKRWLGFTALIGFVTSGWGLWGQVSLARRGWRGLRGRPL